MLDKGGSESLGTVQADSGSVQSLAPDYAAAPAQLLADGTASNAYLGLAIGQVIGQAMTAAGASFDIGGNDNQQAESQPTYHVY